MTVAGKPISNYRLRPREIPAYAPTRRAWERPPLWEFVLLSMLMHAAAIVMFGAPSGGSREGRAMWGALNVVLRGAPVDAGPSLKIARELAAPRTETPKRSPPPPVPAPAPQAILEPLKPTLKLEPRIEPLIPPIAPPAELAAKDVLIPPLLDRVATPDRLPELAPFRMPPPTPVQVAPPVPVVTPPPAPVVAQPVPTPLPAPPPVVAQPVPAPLPLPERVVTPHTEIAPVASPVIPALPSPPVIRPPVELPALPAPTIETAAPVRVEPVAKPVESPAAREVPVAPPPMAAPIQQAPARREAPVAAPSTPSTPSTPFAPTGPGTDPGRTTDPGSKYDPTAPSINVESIRQRAGEMARAGTGNRAVLPFPMPPVPEKKSKMADAIEKARKPDCRTAYSQLGLAAVVPLIANEFGEGSCRW